MAIISARHKCPGCGKEWSMPVNTGRPDWEELEKQMADGKLHLPTLCAVCRPKQRGG